MWIISKSSPLTAGASTAIRKDADEIVCRLVSEALRKKGKVIIPSFSVGRTQQIVYVLHQLTLSGCLSRVPIFGDSPLSVNATEIYRRHTECFNEGISRFLHENANPFGMENLTYVREAEESKKLNELKEPVIIISAAGMCEAGRIRHHLKTISAARKISFCSSATAPNTRSAHKFWQAEARSTSLANPTGSAPKSRPSTPIPATPTGMN